MQTANPITEPDEEADLLPAGWLTEGVQEVSCHRIGEGWQLSLTSAPETGYFGLRLAVSHQADLFSVATVSFAYHVPSRENVATLHLVLREWRRAGPFNFQSQKVLPLSAVSAQAELCLSVRENDMAIEPVLLFEARDARAAAEAMVFIENLRFDVT